MVGASVHSCWERSLFFLPKLKRFESGTQVWATAETEVGMLQIVKGIQASKICPPCTSSLACKHCSPPFSDWLLLQASHRVLTEGEPLALRCHGWQSKLVYNVIFYRDGKHFYSSQDSEVIILQANPSHTGIYHCSGTGRHYRRYTSAGMSVTVKGSGHPMTIGWARTSAEVSSPYPMLFAASTKACQ